jgi:hypothetical protein
VEVHGHYSRGQVNIARCDTNTLDRFLPRESGSSLAGAADRIPAIPARMSNESRETRAESVMRAIYFDFAGFRLMG